MQKQIISDEMVYVKEAVHGSSSCEGNDIVRLSWCKCLC